MTKKHPFISWILFLSIALLSFTSNAQSGKEKNPLPKPGDSIVENGNYPSSPFGEYSEAYYNLDFLNKGIGLPPAEFNFQTPQSTLEHFIRECRSENYKDAAYALNLNLFPETTTLEEAALLCEKFYYVLDKRLSINWDEMPDRPDGQVDMMTSTNKAIAGKPRRSISFGKMSMEERDAVFRLQRVKVKDAGIYWMISPNTVENIDRLYKIYGPRKLDRMMPSWSKYSILGTAAWKIVATLILLLLTYLLGSFVSGVVRKLFRKSDKQWMTMIADKLAKPAGFVVGVLFFNLMLENFVSFSGPLARTLYTVLLIVLIGSITWFAMRFINGMMVYYAQNSIGDSSLKEDPESRRFMTYISVARRILTIVIIVIGLSVVFSQFESLEKLGISLMASAGLASLVIGIAAQDTLGNVIAGIQIALTRPAKIGDTIEVRDELGFVEDITFTYVVVRTWDQKRLVVPCRELVSNVFENWSMKNNHLIKPITFHVDYHTNIDVIREKFSELLKASDKWDGENEPMVEVIEMKEHTLEIRALCSAKTTAVAWDLHCELREKMVAFIAELNSGSSLGRVRVDTNPEK